MTIQANAGQVEKVLEDLIARLSRSQSTAEVRAALIEAKRLRNVTTRWAAIPPPPDARREMLTRVMELIAKVSASLSKPPPPLDAKPSTPPAVSDPPPPRKNSAPPTNNARAFRATEPAMDSVRGAFALKKPRSEAPDSEGPPTLTPREARARGFTPPPIPAVVARGLTPTTPQGRLPPLSQRPAQQRSAPPSDEFASPLTPRSRTGDSFPPPASAPKPATTSVPPDSSPTSSKPRSVQPPPLRGRKPSDMGGPAPSPPPRQAFGSASRSKTKTGLAEADEERLARSNLPTAPPPPLSPAPPNAAAAAAFGSSRRETRLMGSQGVSDVIAALDTEETDRGSLADETAPPPSPVQISISSTPSPAPVNAISIPREGKVDGFSTAISMPNLRSVRAPAPPAKKPSTPTMTLPTPVPAAARSAPPSSSAGKPLRTVISPGVTIVRPEAAQWQPHPTISGATLKLLYRDPRAGIYTALLRLAPGAVFPRRRHAASEEVLLISGIATIGTFELRAGEYCRAESESIHAPITTSTGCTLFVCGSENDEFLEDT